MSVSRFAPNLACQNRKKNKKLQKGQDWGKLKSSKPAVVKDATFASNVYTSHIASQK